MSNARIKKVLAGEFVDFTIDEIDGEFLGDTVKNFIETLGTLGYEAFAVASVAPAYAPQAPSHTGPAQTDGLPTEVEVPADQGQPGQLAKKFRLAIIEITPRQDDKAQVAFYGDDIKPPMNDYPYVTNVYTSKTWVQKFAGIVNFELDDFRKAQRFAVVADVVVRFGDKRAKQGQGNYYRNISSVNAVPGMAPQEVTAFNAPTGGNAPDSAPQEPDDIPF